MTFFFLFITGIYGFYLLELVMSFYRKNPNSAHGHSHLQYELDINVRYYNNLSPCLFSHNILKKQVDKKI